MGRKKTYFGESLTDNRVTYKYYYDRLMELSTSMFEWGNLPDTCDARFMELTLFSQGKSVFFKDDVLGFLTLRCAINGGFDVYRTPVKRRAYADNGYQCDLDISNSVIIWNNYLHQSSELEIRMFAKRLWNLDRIIEVNANAQKTPVLVQGTEQQRLTLLQLYQKWDGNEPFIFGDKNLDINALKVLTTGAPYVADKLYELKTQIWNEALTYLGISNINTVKKERMITDEVSRNMGSTIASRYSRLQCRQEACDKINNMFGLDITCSYREDFRVLEDDATSGESEATTGGGVI